MYVLFRRFGQIVDIKSKTDEAQSFCIEFATIFDERFSRKTGMILFEGIKFSFRSQPIAVKQPCRTTNILHKKLMETPDAESPQNILNALNDDCLLMIFKQLDANAMCQVANVSKRFNITAKQAFRWKYGHQGHLLMKNLCDEQMQSLFRIDLCLRTFGPEMGALEITSDLNINKKVILRMCVEHCPNIEDLQFTGDKWAICMEYSFHSILPRLKKLSLNFPDMEIEDLLVGDWPLEVLSLSGNFDWGKIIIKLPKLNQLHLEGRRSLTEDVFKQCILMCPQIRKLVVNECTIKTSILDMLPTHLPDCEELEFRRCNLATDGNAVNVCEWHRFKSLKALHLNWYGKISKEEILKSLIAGEVPLKSLSIRIDDDNYFLDHIIQLKHLEKIDFECKNTTAIDTHRLKDNLTKLSEITFSGYDITVDRIKDYLRQVAPPPGLSLRFQRSYPYELFVSTNDCEEISSLIQQFAGMDFMVEMPSDRLLVG